MTPALLVLIGLAGGLGAVARFTVDGAVAVRTARAFPLGTFVVNMSGAFVLGLLAGAALSDDAYRIAGTGVIGAYTTFSTWAFESQRLGEDGALGLGALNFGASLVVGLVCAWAGRHVGGWL